MTYCSNGLHSAMFNSSQTEAAIILFKNSRGQNKCFQSVSKLSTAALLTTSAKALSSLRKVMDLSPSREEFVSTSKNTNEAYPPLQSSKI